MASPAVHKRVSKGGPAGGGVSPSVGQRCKRPIQEQQTRGEERAVDAGARSGLVGRGDSRSAETRASAATYTETSAVARAGFPMRVPQEGVGGGRIRARRSRTWPEQADLGGGHGLSSCG